MADIVTHTKSSRRCQLSAAANSTRPHLDRRIQSHLVTSFFKDRLLKPQGLCYSFRERKQTLRKDTLNILGTFP